MLSAAYSPSAGVCSRAYSPDAAGAGALDANATLTPRNRECDARHSGPGPAAANHNQPAWVTGCHDHENWVFGARAGLSPRGAVRGADGHVRRDWPPGLWAS